MLRYALFDLDDTLYPHSSGLWPAIGARINLYLVERLGFRPEEARTERDRYYRAYGTTLNGLRHDYHIDPHEYLAFVHDLPLENYLRPDPALDALLGRLPLSKVIFTNADAAHARRILTFLDIARHFTQIIDIHSLNFVNKPTPAAYTRTLELIAAQPAECIFLDDMVRNLLPARALGIRTVLVSETETSDEVDHCISNILELENILKIDGRVIGRLK